MKKSAEQILMEQLQGNMWDSLNQRELMKVCVINAMDEYKLQEGLGKLHKIGFWNRLKWLLENGTYDSSFMVEKEFVLKTCQEMIDNIENDGRYI